MPEIATSDWEIVLFYNPNSPSASKTLGYAKGEGLPVRDVDILKNPITGTQLEDLAGLLKVSIAGLVNREHPEYEEMFGSAELSDEDWIKVLRKNPEFIKEPIAIRGKHAIFVKTPSDLSRM
jgi:arsenate reductase